MDWLTDLLRRPSLAIEWWDLLDIALVSFLIYELIRNLAGYVVFAIIVLFQSDIRRALAHFGRAPFFRYFARTIEGEEDVVEELAAAGTTLPAPRIGAMR